MKNIINYIKKNKKIIIFIILILLFIFITYITFNDKIKFIDSLVHSQILNIRNKSLTNILIIITNISSAYILIIISIILLFIIKNKKIPLYIILNLILSFTTSQIAKLFFTRNRPIGINLIDASGYSYPSGHSMVSMAYFGFIIYLLHKKINNQKIKITLIITLIITIFLIGFSRIYLGVHYLSDVIAGFLLAIIYLMIYIKNINLEKK